MTDKMKVLVVRQPWASMLAGWWASPEPCDHCGLVGVGPACEWHNSIPERLLIPKLVLIQNQPATYRGPIAICSSRRWAGYNDHDTIIPDGWNTRREVFNHCLGTATLLDVAPVITDGDMRPAGGHYIVNDGYTIKLVDGLGNIHDITYDSKYTDFTPGLWGYLIGNREPFRTPFAYVGHQGRMRPAQPDLVEQIDRHRQLETRDTKATV